MVLTIGLTYEKETEVTYECTAAAIGSGSIEVFATPYMIALMEEAARDAVADALEEGKSTVGTKVSIQHVAATPVGMKVRVKAVLKEINGRSLLYDVEAWDEKEKIGFGSHERFIIDIEKFMNKVSSK